MSGTGQSSQQTQQTSMSTPWAPAAGQLQGLLGQVGAINPQLTGAENSALGGLEGNAGFLQQFQPAVTGLASNLLAGGGANSFAPMVQNAYGNYQSQINPIANGSLNPYDTPGFGDALGTLNSDITNQINGMFAGAGRDLSGLNVQTLARGLSQGEGGLIQNQYNQNVANRLNAAGGLLGAGGSTAGLLSGMNQQGLANQQAGVGAAQSAGDISNSPFLQTLAVEAQKRGIPLSTLAQQMQLVLPAAQAFGTQSGTQNTQKQASLADTFGTWAGGLGKLFAGAGQGYGAAFGGKAAQ